VGLSHIYDDDSIDEGNSTVIPLGADETFTGAGVRNAHTDVLVTLKTDASGTLYIEFSIDNTNWDTSIPFAVTGGVGEFHSVVKGPRYCRIRYVNGSSAQTYFRLSTMYGSFRQPNLSLNRALPADADAIAVRSTNVNHETALGRRSGATTWHKFGRNTDVDTGSPEVMASFGGTFTPRTSATTLSIVSSDANDVNGDTGAHGIVVYGVDGNWAEKIEVVFLTGLTPVVTTSTWLGINRIAIFRAGSSLFNEGTITVTAVTGGETMAEMPVGEGTSQQVIFHVKDNAQCLIDHINADVVRLASGTQPVVTLNLWVFSAVSNAKYKVGTYYIKARIMKTLAQLIMDEIERCALAREPITLSAIEDAVGRHKDGSLENHLVRDPQQPLQVGPKSTIWLEAATTVNNTSCAGRIVLTVHENPV